MLHTYVPIWNGLIVINVDFKDSVVIYTQLRDYYRLIMIIIVIMSYSLTSDSH